MEPIRIGTWHFDPGGRQLRRGTEHCRLTELENDLLAYLVRRGETVSTEELLQEVWKYAPTVQSRAVIHTVRRVRKKLGDEAGRLISVYGEGYTLDVPDTGMLLGRRAALDEVRRMLAAEGMVTVYGLGGVGKTSLAHQLAAPLDSLWVTCRALTDESDFLSAVARALGLGSARVNRPLVARSLREVTPQILVIDGAEVLGRDMYTWLTDLRALHPVPVLVTSRVSETTTASLRLDPLDASDGVALFARCAREVRAGDPLDAALVHELVRAVSGIPLAIELAAARLRLLDLRTLVADLQRDVAALGQREGSVEAVLRAAFGALQPVEQELLAFVGWVARPVDVGTLEEVSGMSRWALLDALDTLVRASLVVEEGRRFRVLDVVSRFVSARSPESAVPRLVLWAVQRARAIVAERRQMPDWTPEVLVAEVPMLRQALRHAATDEDRAHLALAVWRFDAFWGRRQPMRAVLQALDLDALDVALRIEVLHVRAELAPHGTGAGQQVAQSQGVLKLALAHGQPFQKAHAWNRLVFARLTAEGAAGAAEHVDAMLAAAMAEGVPWPTTRRALLLGADVALRLNDLERALARVERAWVATSPESPIATHIQARKAALHQLLGRDDLGVDIAERAYTGAVERRLPMLILVSGYQLLLCAHAAGRWPVVDRVGSVIQDLAEELDPSKLPGILLVRASQPSDEATALLGLEQARAMARHLGRTRIESLAHLELGYRHHMQDGLQAALRHYTAALEVVQGTDWHQARFVAATWAALAAQEMAVEAPVPLDGVGASVGLAGEVLQLARDVLQGGSWRTESARIPVLRRTQTLAVRAVQGGPRQP